MTTTRANAAAAARIGSGLAGRKRAELLGRLRSCFARPEPWLQAGKYVSALVSGLPRRNGWTIAEHAGDKTPDRTQRLLSRASRGTLAAMGEVRRFAVAGLEEAARRWGRRRGLVAGALDETGQVSRARHCCHVPGGQPVSMTRLIRAAGLRWPVEEDFGLGKDCFGLDESQVRLYTATVLVMAALAICAVTAALLRCRTDTQAAPPATPGQPPPADPGMIPLTVPEIRRLLAALLLRPWPPGHAAHWLDWRRRHQARSRWHHQ